MGLISLEDCKKVHVPAIDGQHEALVDLINQLNQAMTGGSDRDIIGRLIETLVDHTRSHFAYEEQLMRDNGYPGFAKHKSEHDGLLQHIVDLADRFSKGDLLLSFAVMMDLKGWALVHIERFDTALGLFLNRQNSASDHPPPENLGQPKAG